MQDSIRKFRRQPIQIRQGNASRPPPLGKFHLRPLRSPLPVAEGMLAVPYTTLGLLQDPRAANNLDLGA